MKRLSKIFSLAMFVAAVLLLPARAAAQAQEPSRQSASPLATASDARQAASETIIPRLIKFSGTLLDQQDQALKGPVGVMFALYAQQTGGAALWVETQNIKPDANGNYTVLLGANSANGLPAELFVSGEARWLGIQVGQQPEHERILLVSVPYALKAGDAETLGGLPASAFVTTNTPGNTSSGGAAPASSSSSPVLPNTQTQSPPKKAQTTPQAATPCSTVTSDGTATVNSIALFTTACNVQGSLMTQASINGFPGVNVAGNNAGLLLNGTGTHQITVTGASSGRLGQDAQGFFFASDTPGAVIKFDTNNSGTLTEWMRITSAGNVGIGTQTPMGKLDVNGNAFIGNNLEVDALGLNSGTSVPGIQFGLGNSGETIASKRTAGGNQTGLDFYTHYLPRMSISNAGNVGIGTQTPAQKLSVAGTIQSTTGGFMFPDATVQSSAGISQAAGDARYAQLGATSNTFTGGITASSFSGSGAGLTNVNAATVGGLAATQLARVDVGNNFTGNQNISGNVGIGTTTPAGRLDVNGNAFIENNLEVDALGLNSGTSVPGIQFGLGNSGETIASKRTAGGNQNGLDFYTGFMPRMSINNAGFVGVGTSSPGALFHVTGSETAADGKGAAIELSNQAATNHWFLRAGSGTPGTNTPPNGFSIADDSAYRMVINAVGQVGIATGTGPGALPGSLVIAQHFGNALADGWSTYSSRRWKMNIHPIPGALAKVERLRGVTYDRKSDGKHEIGVVAEEVGRVVPEVVSYEENGVDAQGVDYARLTALLIQAVKEQQAQIKQQKAQIKALQARLRRIETRSN